MKEYDFRKWLTDVKGYGLGTVATRVSNVLRVCKYEGDLDVLYQKDKCRDLLDRLSYSEMDKIWRREPRHKVPVDGDVYNGTATLKQAVKLYVEFKEGTPTRKVQVPDTDFVIQNGVLISYRGYKEKTLKSRKNFPCLLIFARKFIVRLSILPSKRKLKI